MKTQPFLLSAGISAGIHDFQLLTFDLQQPKNRQTGYRIHHSTNHPTQKSHDP